METVTKSKAYYTAKTRTISGRENGTSRSSDGRLNIKLSPPTSTETGTNPEQLFAAGWSACYEGAISIAARRLKVNLIGETTIDAEIDLCVDKGEYYLQARLNVHIPGLDNDIARKIVDAAHHICPYSKAVHGNILVETNLV